MSHPVNELTTPVTVGAYQTGSYHWQVFAVCFLATIVGGTVSTLMSVYLPVVVREMLDTGSGADFSSVSALISSLYIFGWSLGGPTWGVISDRVGRSRAVILSIFCYGAFTLLTGLSPSWLWIVGARFMTGFGVGGVLVTTTTYLSEVWPQRSRSIAIGILSIGFPVGIVSAGLINNLVFAWRQAFMIGLIPVVISVLAIWIMRDSTAQRVAHENGPRAKAPWENLVIGAVTFGAMLIGLWAIFSWLPTWVQSLVSGDGQQQRGLSMMLLGGGGLIGGYASGYIANAIGFKKSLIVCFVGCFIMSAILFRTNHEFSNIIFLEIGVLALFFGVSQGILAAYIPQLFPTPIRATATGLCFNIGRVLTGAAVFFVGALVEVFGGYSNAIFVFSFVFVLGLIVTVAGRTGETSSKN